MSNSEDTSPPIGLTRETRVTVPLALLVVVITSTAVGYAKWSTTQEQVERHTEDLKAVNAELRALRDTLGEIRGDVKYLVHEKRGKP